MNEIIQALLSRRSIKGYTDRQVPDDLLDTILEAGIYAPSGHNYQSAVAVAIRDKETRDRLSRMNAEILGVTSDPFYNAPCVIAVLADTQRITWLEDGSLVLGNMLNAAHALELGGCWIHRAQQTFDSPEGKALMKKWGLPETFRGVGFCVLGYPAAAPVEKPRNPGRMIKID